jgi:uncharacterized phiE125 gp8 family phage protein
MSLTLITPPTDPVVTLEEVKATARVLHADEDVLLTQLAAAAVSHLDGYTGVLGLCLAPQTWELTYDVFPCGAVKLPLGPVMSVMSVSYMDAAGVLQVLDPAQYQVDTTNGTGWVVPVADWPATGSYLNAARIRFVAGHTVVPSALKVAVRMLAAHWYTNREGQGAFPPAVDALIQPFRKLWVA